MFNKKQKENEVQISCGFNNIIISQWNSCMGQEYDGTGYDRDNSALTGPRLTPSNSGTLLIEQDILINDSIPYVLGFDIYKDNIWQERVYNIQSDEIYNYLLVEYGVGVYDVYVIKNKDSEFYTNIVIN